MVLSKRENEIALLTIKGFSRKEVSERVCIDPGTTKNHMNAIHRKTKTKNGIELLHWYFENNKGINLQKLLE